MIVQVPLGANGQQLGDYWVVLWRCNPILPNEGCALTSTLTSAQPTQRAVQDFFTKASKELRRFATLCKNNLAEYKS